MKLEPIKYNWVLFNTPEYINLTRHHLEMILLIIKKYKNEN